MYKKSIVFSFTIAYTILIIILSLVQLGDVPKLNTGFDDKIAHFLLYALFCLMWFLSFQFFKIKRSLFLAFAFSVLFGLIIELLQSEVTAYRSADVLDFLANTIGALAMSTLIYIKNEVIIKNM